MTRLPSDKTLGEVFSTRASQCMPASGTRTSQTV